MARIVALDLAFLGFPAGIQSRSSSVLAGTLLLGLSSLPGVAEGQVVDSVRVQVEATQKMISQRRLPTRVFIDPRPELRKDSLGAAVLDAFAEAGFEYWAGPGIPPSGVILIAPGRMFSRESQPMVQTAFHAFGDRTEGESYTWHNVYHTTYRLDCAWDGGQCLVGRAVSHLHGDGFVSSTCWADYFSRSEAERRGCWDLDSALRRGGI